MKRCDRPRQTGKFGQILPHFRENGERDRPSPPAKTEENLLLRIINDIIIAGGDSRENAKFCHIIAEAGKMRSPPIRRFPISASIRDRGRRDSSDPQFPTHEIMISPILATVGRILVGSVFFLTGLAKAIEPWKFAQHIAQLRILNSRFIQPVTLTFTALECAVGTALIFNATSAIIIPFSIVLLIALSGLTYWSTSTGRTESCGCYNGWLEVTPTQSIIFNLFYIISLSLSLFLSPKQPGVLWPWMAVCAAFVTGYAAASGSLAYLDRHGYPPIDLAPIQAHRPWQNEWLGEHFNLDFNSGSKLVVFMSPRCPQCKDWLQVLKIVHACPELPDVVGVVAFTYYDELRYFVDSYELNFSVVALEPSQYDRLGIDTLPTAVIVADGTIREKWVAGMPLSFIKRIKEAIPAT